MSFFDLRLPLGWLFAILGILLEIAGLRPTPTSEGVRSSININLIWGAVMIAFALVCFWLAHRHKRKLEHAKPAAAARTPQT
ncbi:MAG TPA: hypothetical protein VGM54_21640 [Chthoniobacter sp.]|jgi:hypothetical protein